MIPVKNVPIRRFSFSPCWLLSKLTIGTPTAGTPMDSMNGAIGTVPPIVRICTGAWPNIRVTAATIWREAGASGDVR